MLLAYELHGISRQKKIMSAEYGVYGGSHGYISALRISSFWFLFGLLSDEVLGIEREQPNDTPGLSAYCIIIPFGFLGGGRQAKSRSFGT